MGAIVTNKGSKLIFEVISMILTKHNCRIKDIDMKTGMFQITGDDKLQVRNCEDDIDKAFIDIYSWGGGVSASKIW